MIHCSNKSWRIHCCKVGRNMIFPQKPNKRRGFAHVRSFKGAFHSRTFLYGREWMGCWGLLGWLLLVIMIIPENSLRLAPVRLYITIKSPPLSSFHHHSHPTDTIHPCNPSPCVSGTCSGRLWDFMLSKCARVCWSMPRGSSTGNFRPLSACTWRLGARAWWPRADRGWVHHGFTMFHQQKGDFNGSDHQYLGDKMGCNNMVILGGSSNES